MKETLAARVGRIISGGAHKIVEAIENAAPETVLEQALREIDGAVDEVRAELGTVAARKHLASERLMEENRKHEELTEKIELALKEDREDLAEAAVARQIDIEAQIPLLENTIADAEDKTRELEGMIAALQARKREMAEDLRQYRVAAEAKAQASTPTLESGGSWERRAEQAQSAFDRIIEKQTGLPPKSNLGNEAKLAELEDLARKNRIQERLVAAKAKLSPS